MNIGIYIAVCQVYMFGLCLGELGWDRTAD